MLVAMRKYVEMMHSYHRYNICAQIFVVGPQSHHETLTDQDKYALREYCEHEDVTLYIHGAYIDYPWTRESDACYNIKVEMQIASELGASGVIVHLGVGADRAETISSVLSQIENAAYSEVILWLEVQASKPSTHTYETPEKIASLFSRVRKCNLKHLQVGLCVDTAHLHSCGVSLQSRLDAAEWFNEVLPVIPRSMSGPQVMIHLNDSSSEVGSGVDVHANLCAGNIWSRYHPTSGDLPFEESGLAYILELAQQQHIAIVMERNVDSMQDDLALLARVNST